MRRLPLLGLLVVLAACGGKSGSGTTTEAAQQPAAGGTAGGCTKVKAPPAGKRTEKKPTKLLDASTTYAIVMKTNCGTFTITLDQKQSPKTAASMVALTKAGFFDRTVFHRIVPGFVIQGGDPTATGTGGPGYLTVDEPPASARYVHGVVAMAKTGAQPPGTSGSQFFVVTGADAGLPPDYAIIGKVTKGIAVVDRIGKLGDASERPTQVVEIEQATVTTSG